MFCWPSSWAQDGSVWGLTGMNTAFGPGVVELAKKEMSFKGSWLRIFMIL